MSGFCPSGLDAPALDNLFSSEFFRTVRKHVHFHNVGEVVYKPVLAQDKVFEVKYGDPIKVIDVEDYSDYLNLALRNDLKKVAEQLGMMAASAYNALLGAAKRKHGFGLTVVDLFANGNLRSYMKLNTEPSVADPMCMIAGWASYKFKFGAGA